MESSFERTAIKTPIKAVLIALALFTLITGGLLSLFVSSHPDGLEWSIEKITGSTELETENKFVEKAASIQEKTAFMPDYNFPRQESAAAGTTLAGILGGVFTFLLAGISALIISVVKKKRSEIRSDSVVDKNIIYKV